MTIIATGTMVSRAVEAADTLRAQGVGARVLNAAYLAPLDIEAIADAARQTNAIITAEEANIAGGLGAAVASVVAQLENEARVPIRILGLTEFAPTGSAEYLLEYFGLTAEDIAKTALEARDHG